MSELASESPSQGFREASTERERGSAMSARIVITGGAGFLGSRLARRLLAGPVALDGDPVDVGEVVLVDLAGPPDDLAADQRVTVVTGELEEAVAGLGDADAVFHLAAVVSGAAEADFDLGTRSCSWPAGRRVSKPARRRSTARNVIGHDRPHDRGAS